MKALGSAIGSTVIQLHTRRGFAWVHAVLALLCFCMALGLTGCLSGAKIPPNSHLRNFQTKTTTPWGSVEVKVDEIDTGKAAINTTQRVPAAQ